MLCACVCVLSHLCTRVLSSLMSFSSVHACMGVHARKSERDRDGLCGNGDELLLYLCMRACVRANVCMHTCLRGDRSYFP